METTDIITIPDDSELSQRLAEAEATGQPLRVATDKRVYRLNITVERRPKTIYELFPDYDPERVLAAFDQAKGVFKGVDTEQLKADLRELRGQDSSGRPGDL
jgi:hypothetical protein